MMKNFQSRAAGYPHASGQGGLLAVAITILIALVLAGTTIAGISRMNATRAVVIKQTLQTYYTAQAGLQEALATRMLPRSNYWNFNALGGGGLTQSQLRYYNRSGLVYRNPDMANPSGLIGQYRYVVLGGDAARKSNGAYYNTNEKRTLPAGDTIPRLLATDTLPQGPPALPAANDSRFIVISNAVTCKRDGAGQKSLAGVDQLNVSGVAPNCKTGYATDEITLIGVVSMLPEGGGSDRLMRTMVVKDRTAIPLPIGAFAPGHGWRNAGQTVNFDTIWSSNGGRAATLKHVTFYNFMTGQIYHDQDITGPTTVIGPAISPKAVIRLYFDGPIDYRSISPGNDRNLDDCKGAGADNCRIRVDMDVDAAGNCTSGPTCAYQGNTMIPLLPGSTQVILLPPLKNTIGATTRHAVKVEGTRLRGYNNVQGSNDYRIIFTTGAS